MNCLHPLYSTFPKPLRFTYPFCYEPHPLCLAAAAEVQRMIAAMHTGDEGKMFGVLVVEDSKGSLYYLAAYSGLLGGRNDWPGFVPPVFDAQQPDGYFKVHEAQISGINRRVAELENGRRRQEATSILASLRQEAKLAVDSYKLRMAEAKSRRDLQRSAGATDEAALIRESQYMKAELQRTKKRYKAMISEQESALQHIEDSIAAMKNERKILSDALQLWLFDQFELLNARGERRPLTAIFREATAHIPPAGTGDCCAPKLLQYAYANGCRPVCMAEFWHGPAPKSEIRRSGHFYPACQGKCKPLLGYMLQGLDVDPDPLSVPRTFDPSGWVVYEDESLLVLNKPAGLLSVPGRGNLPSVVSILEARRPGYVPMPVHRLDMATSGLLVVAKTKDACSRIQRQFENREVKKRYVAIVDGIVSGAPTGTISLPLLRDYLDRPRQKVDYVSGKPSVTVYEVLEKNAGKTRLALYPKTGRTHQLRMHCAHPDGLGCPIAGDELYGRRAARLYLHAEAIELTHPLTGRPLRLEHKADF